MPVIVNKCRLFYFCFGPVFSGAFNFKRELSAWDVSAVIFFNQSKLKMMVQAVGLGSEERAMTSNELVSKFSI